MQVLKAPEYSLAYACDLSFVKSLLCDLDQIRHAPWVTILQNEPKVVVLNVASIVLDNVWALAFLNDLDLLLKCLYLL